MEGRNHFEETSEWKPKKRLSNRDYAEFLIN